MDLLHQQNAKYQRSERAELYIAGWYHFFSFRYMKHVRDISDLVIKLQISKRDIQQLNSYLTLGNSDSGYCNQ